MTEEQQYAAVAGTTLSDSQIAELASTLASEALEDLAADTLGLHERLEDHLGGATSAEYEAHAERLRKAIRAEAGLDDGEDED